jgi:hypothetical protein
VSRATAPGAPEPRLPERLRPLARAVERSGIGGRTDPEAVAIAKQPIAGDLRWSASEVSR